MEYNKNASNNITSFGQNLIQNMSQTIDIERANVDKIISKQDYDKMIQIVNKPVPNVYQISHEDLIKICSSAFNYGLYTLDECLQNNYSISTKNTIIKETKNLFIETELPYLLKNLTK